MPYAHSFLPLGTFASKISLYLELLVVILLGWWFLYYFILELAFGRTVGKFITGTKVVNREGEKPSAGKIALRTLIRFVPFEALSGFRINNEDSTWARGCWHDDWADTIVVKTR